MIVNVKLTMTMTETLFTQANIRRNHVDSQANYFVHSFLSLLYTCDLNQSFRLSERMMSLRTHQLGK